MIWAIIIMVTGAIEIVICFYALFRNEWVHGQLTRMIDEDINRASKLIPHYQEIVQGDKFWRWDINVFVFPE